MFNPGPLNAQAGPEPVGGVETHAALGGRCSACHAPPWGSERMTDRCLVCHTQVAEEMQTPLSLHGAMMTTTAQPCQACHTEHNGPLARLTVVDMKKFPHAQATGFSLQAHQTTSDGVLFTCAHCHQNKVSRFNRQTCQTCHQQLDVTFMQAHTETFGPECLACHDGVDAYGAAFNHNQTAFPLTGAHALNNCAACHRGMFTPAHLQATATNCYACHRDVDAHQGRFGQNCEVCHTPTSWEAVTFDHVQTAFPLNGAHTRVACEACHINNTFAGTPQTCNACHTEPASHLGLFGTDCAGCHTAAAWTPAQFTGPHTFPINHGEGGNNTCQTCHPAGLQTYSCYECHEHRPAKIEEEHREEGIRDFQNCVQCHPTGREKEGEREEREREHDDD